MEAEDLKNGESLKWVGHDKKVMNVLNVGSLKVYTNLKLAVCSADCDVFLDKSLVCLYENITNFCFSLKYILSYGTTQNVYARITKKGEEFHK